FLDSLSVPMSGLVKILPSPRSCIFLFASSTCSVLGELRFRGWIAFLNQLTGLAFSLMLETVHSLQMCLVIAVWEVWGQLACVARTAARRWMTLDAELVASWML